MVRRVNPIPDPKALETVVTSVPVTRFERRTDMQTDDRVVAENGGPSRGRGALIGIAAALVVLVGGAVFLLSNDETPVAAPNATQLQVDDFDVPIEPGSYFVDADADETSSLRGTFVIEGNGWLSMGAGVRKISGDEFIALLVAEVDEVWPEMCPDPAPAPVAAGSTATDLANQFAAFGLTAQETLAPVTAFGFEGHHMVVDVPEACSGESHMAWSGPNWGGRYYQDNGQTVEHWFLDVEGTPVVVEASWFPGSTPEEDVAELREVLDTLVITP
jgi:hypothetical protein